MKRPSPIKIEVRKALEKAVERDCEIPFVARRTGVSAKSLYAFLAKTTLGPENLFALATWLIDAGYLPHDFPVRDPSKIYESRSTISRPQIEEALEISWLGGLPDQFIGIGKDLKSPAFNDQEKLDRLLSFMKDLNQSLNGYIVAFERFGQK